MSLNTHTHYSTAPVSVTQVAGTIGAVVAAAGVGAGVACVAMGQATVQSCMEVYRKCKEEGYPVPIEALQVSHTPLSNFCGFKEMLETQGFTFNALGHAETSMMHTPCSTNREMFVAMNPITNQQMIVFNTNAGIDIISADTELIQTSAQDFATLEFASALTAEGLDVTIKETGNTKIITAYDKNEGDEVTIKVEKEHTKTHIDTRKTKRPKCDYMHLKIQKRVKEPKAAKRKNAEILQRLMSEKIKEPQKTRIVREKHIKRQESIHIRRKV